MLNKAIIKGLVFILFAIHCSQGFCCSLAYHDWKLIFHTKLTTETPFLPLCESDIILKGEFEEAKTVFWVTPKAENTSTLFKAIFIPVFNAMLEKLPLDQYMGAGLPNTLSPNRDKNFPWCKKLSWIPVISGSKLGEILKNHTEKDYIVVGSDKNTLKIALFADANADYKCFQVVFLQDGRLRAVQPSPTRPTATEVRSLAYASIIFYGNPLNGEIMSFSLSPVAGTRCFFLQDETLVARLISEDKLVQMPSTQSDPSSYNIPDIPD